MSEPVTVRKGDVVDYDLQNDSLFSYAHGLKYRTSVDVDGIILDIAEDNSLMSVEILDVSGRFGITRQDVRQSIVSRKLGLDVKLEVSENLINVTLDLKILKRNEEVERVACASAMNSMNLPTGSGSLAMIT
jgi:hypothetical protein